MPGDSSSVPQHIAIIMDGNGRWARERGLPRRDGHRAGAESVREVVEGCRELGVKFLTLYAFSSENWNRPAAEVDALMTLLERFLEKKMGEIHDRGVRLKTIGSIEKLPEKCRRRLEAAKELTRNNTHLTLILALSYGSREEITHAARSLARDAASGSLDPESITPELLASRLYTAPYPDPDLLVRTSGELRISNFLLWQISYSELIISPKYWPDFKKSDLVSAAEEYARRHRRFGGI